MTRAALGFFLLLAALTAPPSSADHTLSLRADIRETGYVALTVHARAGVRLELGEVVPGALGNASAELVLDDENATFRRYARWRCDRRERTFVVRQAEADGTVLTAETTVRTPSCARRLELIGPRAVKAGGRATLRVRDRWRIGRLSARFCARAPGARQRCRAVRLGEGRKPLRLRVSTLRPGGHRLSLRTPYGQVRRTLRARPAGGRLRILATGDSMIQIIDSYLKARAGGTARVRSDAHISTGLSKPSSLNWGEQARRQAAGRPDVVVMFIGANDGFPMAGADCCEAAWVAEYARRARRMMRTYARGGRARVLWLLLPAPRTGFFREIFPAVNSALRRAARGLEDDVRIVDLAEVFTPGGRYRESIDIDGKTVRVRQADGVHLNTAGASIAANIVLRALRTERILRSG